VSEPIVFGAAYSVYVRIVRLALWEKGIPYRLQPDDSKARARMNQITGILDSYAYRPLVWDIYLERVEPPQAGRVSDESKIAAALPKAQLCLRILAGLMADAPFLAGDALSLADLHAAPMFAYFLAVPEGAALMAEQPALTAWWRRVAARPGMTATRPSLNPIA
jgi:glutathione S-transferase